ncbi:MAG: putative collagenase [Bacteroidetes bacterium]|nr:putative collagenase [Bacteroidota bacterium]
MKRSIELLSPAKNAEIGIEAINHGADAVYIGAPKFGARSAAGNSIADIEALAAYARKFDARVYVALNTILRDDELAEAERMVWQLYRAGADALIVQDMGLLQMNLPPIELHASTQTDNRTFNKVKFLEEAGFTQVVLARELSLEQIREIASHTKARIECFVHGALCVSYSGQCYASQVTRGRSANRGECAQLCRLPYSLVDASGNRLSPEGHLLSLKDLDLSAHLGAMLDAGVSSFKIEGRLKEMDYVKNLTAYYRQKLDALLEDSEKYTKASSGTTRHFFMPDPQRTFQRGATSYFLTERNTGLVQTATPKSIGQPIGIAKRIERNSFTVKSLVPLANGDGLCYLAPDGQFTGIRVNRVEGDNVTPLKMPHLKSGIMLYRNFDQEFDKLLSKKSAERKIQVELTLRESATGISIEADAEGNRVMLYIPCEKELSTKDFSDVKENIRVQFSKLGNTDFELQSIRTEFSSPWFFPASKVSEWRRQTVAKLEQAVRINHRPLLRPKTDNKPAYPEQSLTYRGNVANAGARSFYLDRGVAKVEQALEAGGKLQPGQPVMITKYCLKYEMGWCPSKQHPKQAPREPFYLQGKNDRFLLQFDCKNCEMQLLIP